MYMFLIGFLECSHIMFMDFHGCTYCIFPSAIVISKPLVCLGLRCIVKITGDMTLSFPSGIIKIFTSNPSPAVLSFRLNNCTKLEQILPNQQILYRSESHRAACTPAQESLKSPHVTADNSASKAHQCQTGTNVSHFSGAHFSNCSHQL